MYMLYLLSNLIVIVYCNNIYLQTNKRHTPITKATPLFLVGAANAIICSHSRAIYLFIESITSQCQFYGHACSSASRFNDGACLGCPAGGCPVMGYDADKTTQRGSFYLSTAGITPFCGTSIINALQPGD